MATAKLHRLLSGKQQHSLCRYVIDKMSSEQKEVLVWELVRADTWAGRFMFEMMKVKNLGTATALEVLLAVIKESQRDEYSRTV